jgi:acyl dehydratase
VTTTDQSGNPDSLKVSDDVAGEFEKATAYKLTDEDIERSRLLIGHDLGLRYEELYRVASPDAIRNWSRGMGDPNPLYTDDDYGSATRWGSQIAHGTMVGHVKTPMLGDPLPAEVKAGTKSVFRGIHVFVSGGSWEWYRPLFAGDRLYTFAGEESVTVKQSEFANRSVICVRRDVAINQRGEVVGVYRILRVLTERDTARKKGKYAELEAATYTDEDYEKIDAIYAAEKPLGAEKRWWDDVTEGDELQPMVKGPLTVTEIIAVHAGGYGFVPYGLRSSRLGYDNRKRIAPFYVKNAQGIYDVAQRLHWDSEWAKAIGNPMAYDYGVMRQCWFWHMLSDWMGDDGIVVKMDDSIRKFNYQGDTQFLTGKVTAKRIDADGRHVVDIEMHMVNQRGTETAFGSGTVALPSKAKGLPVYPNVPTELAEKAVQMFARHHELSTKQRAL